MGNSPKFIGLVKKKIIYKKIEIISWKKINLKNKFLKYDLILVCGFDYSALSKNYKFFIKKNIIHPLNIIKKCSKNKTKIIYINTLSKKKNYTFSRYEYSKNELGYLITKNFENFHICNLGVLVRNNNILIKGGNYLKFLFKLLIILNYLETQELNKIDFFKKTDTVFKKNFIFLRFLVIYFLINF